MWRSLSLLSLTLWTVQALTPSWPNLYWNIPGDYCRAKYPARNCCNGRQDPCSVEILGTLCYCDTFCNRTHNSDCCPDYFTHCEGLPEIQFDDEKDDEISSEYDDSSPEEIRYPDGKKKVN